MPTISPAHLALVVLEHHRALQLVRQGTERVAAEHGLDKGEDAFRSCRTAHHGKDHARRLGPGGDGGVVELPPLEECNRIFLHIGCVEALAQCGKRKVDVGMWLSAPRASPG